MKRIRSEYMKKFKDPKWDSYSKCYEEMLKYRLARRLLEYSHNPWIWGGSDTDSDSGGRSPMPAGQNQTKDDSPKGRSEGGLEECGAARTAQGKPSEIVPKLVLAEDDNTAHVSQMNGGGEPNVGEEEQRNGTKQLPIPPGKRMQDRRSELPLTQQNKTSKQSRTQRVRPVGIQQTKEDGKSRHPFALYASGEKDSDIASRKTHNVGPAASTKEIHESALRAKTRREVERQLLFQRAERRRAKSADVEKTRLKVVAPEFNPWLTEYMRCFSARSR